MASDKSVSTTREEETKQYLQQHRLLELFNNLTALLIFSKPANPKKFMIDTLEQLQKSQTSKKDSPCIFDDSNILSVFGMLDPTNRGYIAMTQYCEDGSTCNITETQVLEPLLLPNQCNHEELVVGLQSSGHEVPCILCDDKIDVAISTDTYVKHLLEKHYFVIADTNLIANFKSYCLYWKERFKQQPVKDFCSQIQTTQTKQGEDGFYLLSDILPEDKQLREFLQRTKLEFILETQQKEREEMHFSRNCLFCWEHFEGNRSTLFNHMAEKHSFNVGQPDNLVFTNEFLNVLEEKLNSLQCLYCEKTFRDKIVLKEHMRKKQHRKINSKNKTYDKFYVINYAELGKNWENFEHEDMYEPDTADTESEDEWSGWTEEAAGQAVCLYCEFSSSKADKLWLHMQELHDFDLHELKLQLNLNYYQQVKLINYIRRQVHLGICIGCQGKFDSKSTLLDHMHEESHTNVLPDIKEWDQPQYFFPTYENDNLLCHLEDEDDVSDCQGNETVIAEDRIIVDTILSEEKLRNEILSS